MGQEWWIREVFLTQDHPSHLNWKQSVFTRQLFLLDTISKALPRVLQLGLADSLLKSTERLCLKHSIWTISNKSIGRLCDQWAASRYWNLFRPVSQQKDKFHELKKKQISFLDDGYDTYLNYLNANPSWLHGRREFVWLMCFVNEVL